ASTTGGNSQRGSG
nr:Chain H, ALA-SER-THR-THR-GLY-GLY-ASN-SER-GLN-ARG-GLY-SER-GLY [Porphyromonas gingivalis W83]6SLI_P Chain P, ALA-SER-THR-THR-GLY-GLY-ASN-SER-GLN-ARG-GLY-SER-GLY [Porphyromonas gingivalis W83]